MEESSEPQYKQVSFRLTLLRFISPLLLKLTANRRICIARIVCQSLAYLEQFTFVSAMSWQTQIGHDNNRKLRGTSGNLNMVGPGLRAEHLIIGYALPAVLSAVTAAVELSGPKCAFYKPRFGER